MTGTYLIIGNLTVDECPGRQPQSGGAVYYGAAAAAALGWRVRCVTSAAEGPPELPAWLAGRVTWSVKPAATTTTFENSYDPKHRRTQRFLAYGGRLRAADIPQGWGSAKVAHLAPVAHELDPDVLDEVHAPVVGLAAQGWLRELHVGQPVATRDWCVPPALAERSSVIAVSEEDLGGVTAGVSELARLAPILAVTRGAAGAHLYSGGLVTHVVPYAVDPVDTTGAGDVFAATLFARLAEGAPLAEAGRWAATQAAFSVEAVGVFGLRSREALARSV